MSYNEGYMFEDRMEHVLDGKTFYDLNNNLQHFISFVLPKMDRTKRLMCFKAREYTKPDICIKQENETCYVSLKHGIAEGVHEENIDRFVDFLKESGFDDYTIESYLLFHYGDMTTDGTGEKRMDNFGVMATFRERILKLNETLNFDKEFVKKFTDRVLFQGVDPLATPADVIYHGDEEFGQFVSKNQVMRHIERKRWDFMNQVVHIGPFILRPKSRYPNKEVRNPGFRHRVVVSYPRFLSEIAYIFSRYKFY